jgi:hypothetical protein
MSGRTRFISSVSPQGRKLDQLGNFQTELLGRITPASTGIGPTADPDAPPLALPAGLAFAVADGESRCSFSRS